MRQLVIKKKKKIYCKKGKSIIIHHLDNNKNINTEKQFNQKLLLIKLENGDGSIRGLNSYIPG